MKRKGTGKNMTQSENVTSTAHHREWRVGCYDADGLVTQCVINTDHGAVRVGLDIGEKGRFFELRAEQVGKFRIGLDKAIMATRIRAGGEGSHQQLLQYYNNYRQPRVCAIKADHGALRITCGDLLAGTQDCFLELQEEQIGAFRVAFNAALEVFRTDSAIYGTQWADSEDETDELSPIGNEELFTAEINSMVVENAPRRFALCEEIGDRVDAVIVAWGISFDDHAEIISAAHDGAWGRFRSAEKARQLLSRHSTIRLVWIDDPLSDKTRVTKPHVRSLCWCGFLSLVSWLATAYRRVVGHRAF
ncbi:MAG: hypothetical protein ACRERT_15105 [Pseudomonas sp.]